MKSPIFQPDSLIGRFSYRWGVGVEMTMLRLTHKPSHPKIKPIDIVVATNIHVHEMFDGTNKHDLPRTSQSTTPANHAGKPAARSGPDRRDHSEDSGHHRQHG